MAETLKLKRHETFSIREGWIEKAINYVYENPFCFRKDDGPKILGMGTNMVKSLHYWVTASNLVQFHINTGATLTECGSLIYEFDQYLTNKFTWWIIHYNLSTNFNDAPVINKIFNSDLNKFEKDFLTNSILNVLEKDYEIKSLGSLESDVQIYLKSYFSSDKSNPENNFNCPLSKLNLLDMVSKNVYEKEMPNTNDLDFRIVYRCLLDCMDIDGGNLSRAHFNVEDLYDKDNNPLKIFNLSKSALFYYLDVLKQKGYISLHKTAGLNTIYIEKYMSLRAMFEGYFRED